jgi:hypothetical protein
MIARINQHGATSIPLGAQLSSPVRLLEGQPKEAAMLLSERRAQHAVMTDSDEGNAVSPSATSGLDLTPTAAWSRRVRRVGGMIQAGFAAFWLVRASLVIGGGVSYALIAASGVTLIAVLSYAISATAGTAPRPRGPEGKRIERDINLATVIELVAAFALPVLVISAGHSDWVLPSVAITIGPLLLYIGRRVHIPRYRPVGWALTVGPVILVATMSGTPLIATTGIVAGLLMFATAIAGFHDLAEVRGRMEQAETSKLSVA